MRPIVTPTTRLCHSGLPVIQYRRIDRATTTTVLIGFSPKETRRMDHLWRDRMAYILGAAKPPDGVCVFC